MSKIVNNFWLKKQYANDSNLNARARLHQLYNVNQQPLQEWFFEQISLPNNARILELGCGNGSLWEEHIDKLDSNAKLTMTDYSSGMVDIVREKFSNNSKISFEIADAQNLTFSSQSFDIVIANHTLHHVNNIDLAISEIARVLKPNGVFYATTNGTKGLENYFYEIIQKISPTNRAFSEPLPFNLENAHNLLSRHFLKIAKTYFPNSLSITSFADLMEWLEASRDMQPDIDDKLLNKLHNYFDNILQKNGQINIPKEVGLMTASQPFETQNQDL